MSDIQKKSEFTIERLDNYLKSLKEMQNRIFAELEEGVDYGFPFEKATQKILYFSGARKLAKIMRVSVEIKVDETIVRNGEEWGKKYVLRMTLPNGDFVESVGICTYDEEASWHRDKKDPNVRRKKPFYMLSQIAYKRAFVNGIKILLGLADFVDYQLEEIEKGKDVQEVEYEEITEGVTATDKQLLFFADLFLKRHLDKNTAFKIVKRLSDRYETGEGITKDVISNAIDYLVKYKKLDDEAYYKSWDNLNDEKIWALKVEWLVDLFKKMNKYEVLKDLGGEIGEEKDEFPF